MTSGVNCFWPGGVWNREILFRIGFFPTGPESAIWRLPIFAYLCFSNLEGRTAMRLEESRSDAIMDIASFNRLFGDYQQRFIRFAVSYIADPVAAEDIVMESFAAAWGRREMLTVDSFPPYTLTIVKNKCLNYLRAQGVRSRASEEMHTHESRMLRTRIATLQACDPEELFSEEARRLVEETLAGLPARTRDIFIRSRYQGQSYKEIAAETGLTVKSVEFEISKAMKALRIALKDYLAYFIFWFYID